MTESIIGVLIGGGITIISSFLFHYFNFWQGRKNWKRNKKAEALSKVLLFSYRIKNKGSKVIHGQPKGKHLSQEDIREMFSDAAELKYWIASSEIYVNKRNKKALRDLRNQLDESYIPFHNFIQREEDEKTRNNSDPKLDQKIFDKIIDIANKEL